MKKAALGTFLLGAAIGTFTTLWLKRYTQTKGLPKKIKRSQGEYYAHDSTRDKFYKIEAQEFKELIASDNYTQAPDQKAGETIYTIKILKAGGEIENKVPQSTKIQTLIFDKKGFGKGDARTWAYEHGFRHRTVEETENSYRVRQSDPENFDKESFRTIELKEGIKAVVAKPVEMAKGGKVYDAKTQEQITKLEKAIASPATPDNFKEVMKKKLAILKSRKPVTAEQTQKTEKEKQEKIKQALKELELSSENIEACQKVINEHRKAQREAAGPQPKKKRITLFKEKMESVTGYLSKQVKDDEKAQTKIKNLTEKYIVSVGLVIFGSDAKTLNPAKVKEMVEEKFAKMEGGGSVSNRILYRLMNHDNYNTYDTPPIFEKFSIEELNKQFRTNYSTVEEAIDEDPEYLFSEEEVKEMVEEKFAKMEGGGLKRSKMETLRDLAKKASETTSNKTEQIVLKIASESKTEEMAGKLLIKYKESLMSQGILNEEDYKMDSAGKWDEMLYALQNTGNPEDYEESFVLLRSLN